jgi:hypothetical protein
MLDMQVQWHYPAGKIAYTSQWLVGGPDDELLAGISHPRSPPRSLSIYIHTLVGGPG